MPAKPRSIPRLGLGRGKVTEAFHNVGSSYEPTLIIDDRKSANAAAANAATGQETRHDRERKSHRFFDGRSKHLMCSAPPTNQPSATGRRTQAEFIESENAAGLSYFFAFGPSVARGDNR
jgi:hypothetical protein